MKDEHDSADETTVREVCDHILALPVPDPPARAAGLRAHGFVLLAGAEAVLIDTVREAHLAALKRLGEAGRRPVALLLTHRHLIGLSDALPRVAEELDVPVFLHPIDAASPTARASGMRFLDPTQSALLDRLGVEALLFPGHTSGSVLLRWRAHGGVLFTGDSAVGPTIEQASAGEIVILRPPASLSDDDDELRRSWEAFDLPAVSLCTFHGEQVIGRPDLARLLSPLRRPEPSPEFAR